MVVIGSLVSRFTSSAIAPPHQGLGPLVSITTTSFDLTNTTVLPHSGCRRDEKQIRPQLLHFDRRQLAAAWRTSGPSNSKRPALLNSAPSASSDITVDHGVRSATSGSTRAMRRAGMSVARMATTRNIADTTANVVGSTGVMPKSTPCR